MDKCVFCRVVTGELPSKKIFEDGEVIVVNDIHPTAPVHMLVVPKKHIAKLSEASIDDQTLLGKIQLVAAKVAEESGIGSTFRVLMANGEKAGQSVFHLHYHVIGGWENGAPMMEAH